MGTFNGPCVINLYVDLIVTNEKWPGTRAVAGFPIKRSVLKNQFQDGLGVPSGNDEHGYLGKL